MYKVGDVVDYKNQKSHVKGTVESIVDSDYVMVRESYGPTALGPNRDRFAPLTKTWVETIQPHRHGSMCRCDEMR